jgi:hypothetical protein
MYYSLFFVPALLIGFVAVRATTSPFNVYDSFDQMLAIVGGVMFLALTYNVYRLMMARAK